MGMLGSYEHKLDSKGRMVLPASFRDVLGSTVVAAIGIGSARFVSIYSLGEWEIFTAKLDNVALKSAGGRELKRLVSSSARPLEIDTAGRILLPQNLRNMAGIAQEVSVNGNGDHLEVWNMDAWSDYMQSMFSDIGELIEGIEGI